MSYVTSNNKITVLSGIIVACVVLECFGIYRMMNKLLSGGSPSDVAFVAIGLVVGVPAALWRHYLKANQNPSLERMRTEMDILNSSVKKKRQ